MVTSIRGATFTVLTVKRLAGRDDLKYGGGLQQPYANTFI